MGWLASRSATLMLRRSAAPEGSAHLGPRATREDGAIMAIREAYKNTPEGTRNFTVHTRDPKAARVGEGRAVPTTSTRAAQEVRNLTTTRRWGVKYLQECPDYAKAAWVIPDWKRENECYATQGWLKKFVFKRKERLEWEWEERRPRSYRELGLEFESPHAVIKE